MRFLFLPLLVLAVAASRPVRGQPEEGEAPPYGSGVGLVIQLTNSSFEVGGYGKRAVSPSLSVHGALSLGAGKDESEATLSNVFGQRAVQGKANYFLMLPVRIGLQRRLFRRRVVRNLRPFIQLSVGPTIGYAYPYFADKNGNGRYEPLDGDTRFNPFRSLLRGHLRMGMGLLAAIGAHFGWSEKSSRGVRIGFRLDYFPEGVQLLEPGRSDPQRVFSTPAIAIIFGRVL